ncbi:Rv3235 family protein [Streptomyces canus]|uniref:Rv3235 family protein n=1 Tax=Streptomyces canus TaxID=58343 RepID=UPI000382E192|nr:Rv3235 family protein [Streptomyces canus]
MNKVMTRAQHPSGTRPSARRDSRRPGGTPPRTPGGSTPRTAPGDGRPPGSPGSGPRTRTGPTDSRPQSIPGPNATTTGAARRGTTADATTTGTRGTTSGTDSASTGPGNTATATRTAAHGTATPAVVPPQAPRRPVVPQPRPTDLFADLLLAVLSGQRPVHSMLRHTAGRAYDELARLAERGPLRTRGARPVVRDIGYYVPRQGAVEAFARIGAGDQLRAMAFRLEQGQDLRWRCTAVELGGSRAPRPDED